VRRIHASVLSITLVGCWVVASEIRGAAQNPPAAFSPTAGDYATADIRVITPGVVFASGLPYIAAGFAR
jgi:hypothetical protein